MSLAGIGCAGWNCTTDLQLMRLASYFCSTALESKNPASRIPGARFGIVALLISVEQGGGQGVG